MDLLDPYRESLTVLDRDQFIAKYGTGKLLYLVKRPHMGSLHPNIAALGDSFVFETLHTPLLAENDMTDEHGPFLHAWRLAKLEKRPGNPFLGRISVGRASNCDVVLKLPFVSKLHAHFIFDEVGNVRLTDQGSANGTALNGVNLKAKAPHPVVLGDKIRIGALEFELHNAAGLYDLLRPDPKTPPSPPSPQH